MLCLLVQQLTWEPECLANVIESSKVRQIKYHEMTIYAVFFAVEFVKQAVNLQRSKESGGEMSR